MQIFTWLDVMRAACSSSYFQCVNFMLHNLKMLSICPTYTKVFHIESHSSVFNPSACTCPAKHLRSSFCPLVRRINGLKGTGSTVKIVTSKRKIFHTMHMKGSCKHGKSTFHLILVMNSTRKQWDAFITEEWKMVIMKMLCLLHKQKKLKLTEQEAFIRSC